MAASLPALSGCASHTLTQSARLADNATSSRRDPASDSVFEYPRAEVPFSNHLLGQGATSEYQLRQLKIPSIGENGQDDNLLTAHYYQSSTSGPRPLVIVLPIWARFTYPSRKISSFVQKHSEGAVHVLDLQGTDFLFDWEGLAIAADEESFTELLRQGVEREQVTVIDVRRLVDWAEQRPEIDASRVALIGFSRGAMVAGTVATQEPRLAAAVLVVGGAHPHLIAARCTGERTTKVQRHTESSFGWSQDELEHRLESAFHTIDPANYPERVNPERVLLFEASHDTCVPESSRTALWETMGRPQRYDLPYGHRRVFLSMTPLAGNWMCHRIWEFLEARLLEQG